MTRSASDPLTGIWRGEVTQGTETYSLIMTVRQLEIGEVAGTAFYSGAFTCTGTLTLEADTGGIWVFREAVDDPEVCADDGRIEVTWRGDALQWAWYFTDDDRQPEATALLRK